MATIQEVITGSIPVLVTGYEGDLDMSADIIDAEVVEDFNVDEVFKPQVVHEVEVYAGPDDTAARTNLRQAGEIEKSAQWAKARLIACSVEKSKPGPKSSSPQGDKLGVRGAAEVMQVSAQTITAYLKAWNAAAADGLCAPSTDLTPADGCTAGMPDPEDWAHYWGGNSHSAKPEPTVSERDWPVVPEPTPEEQLRRFEETRERLVEQGVLPPRRTQEEEDAAADEFVESLVGSRRSTPSGTDQRTRHLNAVGELLARSEPINTDGLTANGLRAAQLLGVA